MKRTNEISKRTDLEVIIKELPEVNQSEYPLIPEPIMGYHFQIADSGLNKYEEEVVVCALLNAAINAGKWGPVNAKEFMIHVANIYPQNSGVIVESAYKLSERKMLNILNLGEDKFLLPSPKLASYVDTAKLREYKPNRVLVIDQSQA